MAIPAIALVALVATAATSLGNLARQQPCDYLIVVGVNDLATAMQPLVTWKTSIGYTVRVVTRDQIFQAVPAGDDAERIWTYLHDRYPASSWGFHYVLLVGDVDLIPQRFLYPDGNPGDGAPYPTDFYYANLDVTDWDADNDDRWGEFTEDDLDTVHEVVVGRIPNNDPADVQSICDSIVAFEQDTGAWKRSMLLAHGMMDYTDTSEKTDTAVTAEMLRFEILDQHGWTYETLYEGLGLEPSSHVGPIALDQTSYDNACGAGTHGIVNAMAHGNAGSMSSYVWIADPDNDGIWDPGPDDGELSSNAFSNRHNVPAHPAGSVVYLCGCDTGQIMDRDPAFNASALRSRYLIRIPNDAVLVDAYMDHGAPVVIGATRSSEYAHAWDALADGGQQTLNYYFHRRIIERNQRVGDAFHDAQREYAEDTSLGLVRGIRDFHYYGDPSLALLGIDARPGGPDVMVHEGYYYDFGADNDDTGDIYVAAVVTPPDVSPGLVNVYRSTDHGQTWATWSTIQHDTPVLAVDVAVSRWVWTTVGEDRLLVFFSADPGQLWLDRIVLSDPLNHEVIQVSDDGGENDIERIAVSREPGAMPFDLHLHLTWEVTSSSLSRVRAAHSADNGSTWDRYVLHDDYHMPHIEAGPNGRVFLVASYAFGPDHVDVQQSTDRGQTWSEWTDLTAGDGSGTTDAHYAPVVAASTDPAHPTVWVSYQHIKNSAPAERTLRGAFSTDSGQTWTRNRTIAAPGGMDVFAPDLEAYSPAANQWVNLAYNQQAHSGSGVRVVWRHSSGATPRSWSAERIENDVDGAWSAPEVVYSPGASLPGSGVVYGGVTRENLFFSAPWLAGPRALAAAGRVEPPDARRRQHEVQGSAAAATSGTAPRSPLPQEPLLTWLESGELEGALTVASLLEVEASHVYAAGVAQDPGGPLMGSVYESTDGGDTWTRHSPLDGSIALATLLETSAGTLLTGGIAAHGPERPGIIYRHDAVSGEWNVVHELPDGVVTTLVEATTGEIYAATGWGGLLFRSFDDGLTWELAAELGAGVKIETVVAASNGVVFAALSGPGALAPIVRSMNGAEWEPTAGIPGDAVIEALAECGDQLYAGGRVADEALVFEAALDGAAWNLVPAPGGGEIVAVQSLACGPSAELYAGAGSRLGPNTTSVFVKPPGGSSWQRFGGIIDQATTVYDILITDTMVDVATGHVQGNVYRCGLQQVVGIEEDAGTPPRPSHPTAYATPNPFHPATTIAFELPRGAVISISIHDAAGRRVRTLEEGAWRDPGTHRIRWDGRDGAGEAVPAGVFFYRVTAGANVITGKLTLVR